MLVEHITAPGDLTILVERDRYQKKRAFASVGIWTTDTKFTSYLSNRSQLGSEPLGHCLGVDINGQRLA
ncbi:hypothetical protein JOF57_006261 [Mycolicibacterium lutetiense]|uniref:Transposase n=1 Tax=Mycolicibacterium lutetiense TaxID=1641992 RepID=A0ABS5A3E6_9MYCO|nr:hypothetical protein [Mycolicibacterium lutetiense]